MILIKMSSRYKKNILTNKELILLVEVLNNKRHILNLKKISTIIIKKALISYSFTETDIWFLSEVSDSLFPFLYKNKNVSLSLMLLASINTGYTQGIKDIIKNNKLLYDDAISSLEWAAEEGEIEIINKLIKKYNINILRDGMDAVNNAMIYNNKSLVPLLKEINYLETNVLLHETISDNDILTTKIILQDPKADLSVRKFEIFFQTHRREQWILLKILADHKSVKLAKRPNASILDIIIKIFK